MADFLDHYIENIKSKNTSKRIYHYLNTKLIEQKFFFNSIIIQFEILKIKLELRNNYINLGKFISKYYNKEKVQDFSYKEDFFYLNNEINKCNRYIRKLKARNK